MHESIRLTDTNSESESTETPVALITGGTDGIGRAVASQLAQAGLRVLLVGRNRDRGFEAARQLRSEQLRSGNPLVEHQFLSADLSLLSETAALANTVSRLTDRLDALVCCAGNFSLRPEWTSEGLERSLVLNYLSRFLLARRFLPALSRAPSGRLVLVSNAGNYGDSLDINDLQYRHGRPGLRVSARTQFANDLLAVELADRYQNTAVEVTCVFPGVVRTDLFRHATGVPRPLRVMLTTLAGRFGLPLDVAADTPAWLATSPQASGLSGSFVGPHRKLRTVPDRARRPDRRQALWDASEALTAEWMAPD